LGVDWLKLEEMFPATPRAQRELLSPLDPRLVAARHALAGHLAAAGIVFVDHVAPPEGCGCLAADDPALATFRAADNFANRADFQPCRMLWEQAAVDPDGTVHAIDP